MENGSEEKTVIIDSSELKELKEFKENNERKLKKLKRNGWSPEHTLLAITLVVGLVSGAVIATDFKNYSQAPVKSLTKTVMGGTFGMLGSMLYSAILPEGLRLFVPVAMSGAALHHLNKN
jgi:hypothetical protein